MVPPGAPRPVWADTRWMPLLAGAKRRARRAFPGWPDENRRRDFVPRPSAAARATRIRAMAAKRSLARVAGLDVDVLSRLEGHNFRTAEDVLTRSSLDLVEVLDISLPTAERVVASVARNVCPKPTTARALLASRASEPTTADPSDVPRAANQVGAASGAPSTSGGPAFVRSHLPALDDALGGGVPTGSISELVAPPARARPNCASPSPSPPPPRPPPAGWRRRRLRRHRAEVQRRATRRDRPGQVPSRLRRPCRGDRRREALRRLTSRVLVLTPSTLSEILQRLNGLEEALIDHGVRLLVVDSMAALARAEFGHGQLTRRQELLGQIAAVLKRKAERLHMAAFVTNQVTTRLAARRPRWAARAGAARTAVTTKAADRRQRRWARSGRTASTRESSWRAPPRRRGLPRDRARRRGDGSSRWSNRRGARWSVSSTTFGRGACESTPTRESACTPRAETSTAAFEASTAEARCDASGREARDASGRETRADERTSGRADERADEVAGAPARRSRDDTRATR